MWLEYNSPRLDDKQFANLTPNLQKKYIGLGFDLSGTQLRNASETVIAGDQHPEQNKFCRPGQQSRHARSERRSDPQSIFWSDDLNIRKRQFYTLLSLWRSAFDPALGEV